MVFFLNILSINCYIKRACCVTVFNNNHPWADILYKPIVFRSVFKKNRITIILRLSKKA